MKAKLVVGSLLAFTMVSNAQWTTSGTNIYNSNTGNVGIGTTAPSQKLDVRGGAIHVVNSSTLPYSFIGRDANPGNDSYFYHRMTTNYHILGSSKNGTGTMRKLGFAIGGSDLEADVKMTIIPNGNVGIGTASPSRKMHVSDDATNMTNNPQYSNGYFIEPDYSASYHELLNSSKQGWHAALHGYDLNNGSGASHPTWGWPANNGIGVFGKAERTATPLGFSFSIGVFGKGIGSYYNVGGLFEGGNQEIIGEKQTSNEAGNGSNQKISYGIWAGAFGSSGTSAYFNGSAYSTANYQSSDMELKRDVKPLTQAIERINSLRPNSFSFKTDEHKSMNLPEGTQMGLTAQEVEKNFPELVSEMTDISDYLKTGEAGKIKTYKAVNYTNLIPLLIAGMQEQQAQLQEQKEENQELKNLVAILQQQSNDLLAKTSDPTGINNLVSQTDGFSMDQNIPNPFSNETQVRYTLPQNTGRAYMAVYDLSGKQIKTFPLTQKGSSSVAISSEKLAAGIYIYSIIADGKVMDSKRMVVAEKQ